jgi:hypothetical protein
MPVPAVIDQYVFTPLDFERVFGNYNWAHVGVRPDQMFGYRPMPGWSYYPCASRCGRPTVRADQLESAIFDLIRRSLITPDAIRQMVEILNSDLELRNSRRSDDHDRAISQVRSLERQDASLRSALRTAAPSAAERISVELDSVAGELRDAARRADTFDVKVRPYRITKRLVQELFDQMSGLIEHASVETRVAWVRDLFEQLEVDGAEQRGIARWKAPADQDVDRLESVTEWLRRAGAGHLLRSLGETSSEVSLPRPTRSREWLKVALLECGHCHQVVERHSPVQRYCSECAETLARVRSRSAMTHRRRGGL